MEKYYAYILECSDGTYYCGYTNDIAAREKTHNDGQGAKYTRGRRPVKMVYSECFETKSEAMKRECALKKLTRLQKEMLVKNKR